MKAKTIIVLTLFIILILPTFSQGYMNLPKEKKPKAKYSWKPFVVGGAAIGKPTSLRLQAGIVKKRYGWYLAGLTNFHVKKRYDCGEEVGHLWSGKHFYNRWAFHIGPIIRFSPNFMMYVGAGSGKCFLVEETLSGHKMYSHHSGTTHWTYEIDLGFIYRIKRYAISTGFTGGTELRYISFVTVNIGVGIMF